MPAVNAPSLAHRAAEDIDPRLPVPEPVLSTTPDPALQQQLDSTIGRAKGGNEAFEAAAPAVEKAVADAGPAQSESWIAAQQALSTLVSLRSPVTSAAADIDALGAERVQKLGGLAAADLKALDAASAEVRRIDEAEAAVIDRLQSRLQH
jgi:hypothetical protein